MREDLCAVSYIEISCGCIIWIYSCTIRKKVADIADGALWDYQSAKYPEALERLADETQQYIAAGQVYPIDPK